MYPVLRKFKTIEYIVCIIFFALLSGVLIVHPQDIYISILGYTMSCGFIIISIHHLFWGQCSHKFSISDEGIKYHTRKQTYYMKWDEVEYISVWKNRNGPINKYSMIGFEKNLYVKFDLCTREHNVHKVYSYNNSFFGVQYREEIVDEIRKRWTKLIPGLNAIEEQKD